MAAWPAPGNVRALTTTRYLQAGAPGGGKAAARGSTALPAAAAQRELVRAATTGHAGQHHSGRCTEGNLQWLRQVHGSRSVHASAESCGTTPEADAAWTADTGLGLVVQTADCVPIVVTECSGRRIGIAHGGWRGLAAGVVARLVESMAAETPLIAWIGPAIGVDAYEVGEEVYTAMHAAFGPALLRKVFHPGRRIGKRQLDLYALTARLLAEAGVREVHGQRLCTHSDPRFYSHRRNATTGRMATVVWKTAGRT